MKKIFFIFAGLFMMTSVLSASSFVKDEYDDVKAKMTKADFTECLKARYRNKFAVVEAVMSEPKKVAELDSTINKVCKDKKPVGTVTRDGITKNVYHVIYAQKSEPKECTNSPDTNDEHAKGKSWYIAEGQCEKYYNKN